MDIIEPTQEEVASIVAANPTRCARLVHISVVGDRGKPVRLPFVLGNPTGACKLPPAKTTTIWSSFVAAALRRERLPEGEDAAAQDVMLWPNAETWAKWSERWPALAGQVWKAAKQKCGASLEAMSEPAYDDPRLPEAVQAALAQYPSASLRRLQPRGASFLLVIDAPGSVAWRMFIAATREGKNVDRTVAEMAQACTHVIFDEKQAAPVAFDAVMAQWPGLAVSACLTISVLAGAASEIELGES